ncbi:class I SAM-dependent RNA methyltransferase [Mesorhizobium koreense]|uniref:class I SAM-dependent RNA methyltransferase n=1 Tax=Mesorhizobium koreense TaxID=3074855 RepID=UPI00287BB82D|nr:class I SAM-dependent RNA methyltransferase [Mesorhizobium sp. WR6]
MSAEFRIERLGAQGDGVVLTERGPVYIPFTLAGERVTASRNGDRADLLAVVEPSPLRVEPACRHFGECGGCALQHMEEGAYREWKRGRVVEALRSRGIETEVAPLVPCPPKERRRVTLSARRTEAGMLLGYNRALSHTIVDIEECPIARPEIVAALEPLRSLAKTICSTDKAFRLTVTVTGSGLDVAAHGSGKFAEKTRKAASDFTLRAGFARLSVDGEIVIEPRKPVVLFGDVPVSPPPGAFLQAVAGAEQTMADLVSVHLSKVKRIADLFSGVGAFALRLAKGTEIHAVEADAASLSALDRGFRFGSGLKRVTTERRDLFVRPVTAKELNAFDGIVFDPPRAGAEAQSRQIAKSDVLLVAAISCNPATLARDLTILIEAGYTLQRVVPIDQFLWSPHVEAVALLTRKKRRR